MDLERGQSYTVGNTHADYNINTNTTSSQFVETIQDLYNSQALERVIEEGSNFFRGIFEPEETIDGVEPEPSNQGMVREILAAFSRLGDAIAGFAVYFWFHSSEFFASAWDFLRDSAKLLDAQG